MHERRNRKAESAEERSAEAGAEAERSAEPEERAAQQTKRPLINSIRGEARPVRRAFPDTPGARADGNTAARIRDILRKRELHCAVCRDILFSTQGYILKRRDNYGRFCNEYRR